MSQGLETETLELPGWQHVYSGKVRDLYIPADAAGIESSDYLLVVASDRISAFDFVLNPPITGKGAVLTALSNWWFEQLEVPNHLVVGAEVAGAPEVPAAVADRAMLTKRLDMYPIECVVRGALTGSGYAEYLRTGEVCGIALPAGMNDGDLLDQPIYTPAYKAPFGEHDENITFEQSAEIVGLEAATALRDVSLSIFAKARELAASRGVLLADTKFEFGRDPQSGELTLADEVLTSDSSRYWDATLYAAGGADRLSSFDKQIVRNWLSANWDKQGEPPVLPDEIVAQTLDRYRELFTRIAG
ncbi:phosphoribosylaminoimidazolesuccinocarboxamide synthase [Leucobacter sp. UT-8R-CII-1-4]|uniref:phosphoribosylaminoimidazolesuccinocarboxamide synthase n=1 Tax=Leucobacter sp. UT-8R-CII-1-4 TaxID=3040075 RepID=UPI0024A86BF5|nr:phosphoribosylaminoimidazolesuccinocarboxamide synthase [Leucobacter sp. UT-8R-CII-1-4]MDI6022495.1 phosphoribosylaminoimidazolesuccinocarboxamide synthase [Leucobacter sp. UT-8R-CII-1-4]